MGRILEDDALSKLAICAGETGMKVEVVGRLNDQFNRFNDRLSGRLQG